MSSSIPAPFELLTVSVETPGRVVDTNHVPNPSFQTGTAGWSGGGRISLGRQVGPVPAVGPGSWIAAATATNTIPANHNLLQFDPGQLLPVTPGVWSFGWWAAPGNAGAGEQLRCLVVGQPEFGNLAVVTQDLVAGSMTQGRAEGVIVPAGCTHVQLLFRRGHGGGDSPAGAKWYWDAFQAHRGATLPADGYFDGSTPDGEDGSTYAWTGPEHASASVRVQDVTDLTGPTQGVSIERGGTTEGRILAVQAGTAQVTILGDNPAIVPGAEVIVAHRQVDERLFTGTVQDVATTFTVKAGRRYARTTITAADAVAVLANRMRYGVVSDNEGAGDFYPERYRKLLASAPEVPEATIAPMTEGLHGWLQSVVYESTVANHLDMTAASVGQGWWIDRYGRFRADDCSTTTRPGGIPREHRTFADDRTGLADNYQLDYIAYGDVTVARSTRDHVSEVAITNHGRAPDPDDPTNHLADDRAHGPYESVPARELAGRRAITLDTAVATISRAAGGDPVFTPERVDTLGQWWVQQFRPVTRPTHVRVNAGDQYRVTTRVTADRLLARLGIDVGGWCQVRYDGTVTTCYVTRIRHTITQQSWHAEYDLGRNTREDPA